MTISRISHAHQFSPHAFSELLDAPSTWDETQGSLFLHNPDNALFVAYDDQLPIGFVTAHRLQRFDARKAEVFLYEIGVHEAYRRQGIAKALIEEVQRWAKEVGADVVWVLTEHSNEAAKALYTVTGGVEDEPLTAMFTYKL